MWFLMGLRLLEILAKGDGAFSVLFTSSPLPQKLQRKCVPARTSSLPTEQVLPVLPCLTLLVHQLCGLFLVNRAFTILVTYASRQARG